MHLNRFAINPNLKPILVLVAKINQNQFLRFRDTAHESKEVVKDDLGEERRGFPRGVLDTSDKEIIK